MSDAALLGLLPYLTLIFILSGTVKGMTGFGMPFVAIPATTLMLGIPVTQAMGWVLVSGFATNIVQLLQTRACWTVLRRIWIPVLVLLGTMALSVQMLSVLDSEWLLVALGLVIVVAVSFQLKRQWTIRSDWQGMALVFSGMISGLFGGLTAFYGFPVLPTLLASGIREQSFIFAASFILFTGAMVLAVGLSSQGFMTITDALLSVLLFLPALLGMLLGQWIRRRLRPELFERIVLVVLLGTGVSMLVRGLDAVLK